MIDKLSTTSFHFAGRLLAICFIVSLFMCGDAECLTGGDDENCASLLCSLLSKHEASPRNTAGGADNDCSCVCHVPTVTGPVFDFSFHPAGQYNIVADLLQISSAHNRLVYHPPAFV